MTQTQPAPVRPSTSPARAGGPNPTAKLDAVVIGSGPNGLGAAIELARAGRSVVVYEAAGVVGGGMRSGELTLPGYTHDMGSTIHALSLASPFVQSLPLKDFGVEFVHPEFPLAHPLDDGSAVLLSRSVAETAARLGRDGPAYQHFFQPLVDDWAKLAPMLLAPAVRLPRHPFVMARFGLPALQSARAFVERQFKTVAAKALFGGVAAHSVLPLEWRGSGAYGMVLTIGAHANGWPVARGGSQTLADGMAAYFRSLGGTIELNRPVASLADLPPAKAVLCDTSPEALVRIAGNVLPAAYAKKLTSFTRGPAVFKVDFALSAPVPWRNADVARAGTVHLGGTFDELAESEHLAWEGRAAPKPYVLLVQPTLFDPTRAPAGRHTLWAYCHVPHGSGVDMTDRIVAQIERFAPGFRDVVASQRSSGPRDLEAWNANLVGGDIVGGAQTLWQTLARPVLGTNPYATPVKGLYLCSSSTPPGAGVHAMCGYHAARAAMKRMG
ncbi:MAG: phytoene dehydrogenase family FAD-dependent oxidoreductase [Phycisphaerales bacterium]|nr:phytoene dehydrogenase family FAD-dependent oxidoreductase [Phycisphaerales bacterium]